MQLESSPDVSTGFLPVLRENNGFSKTKPMIPPSREKRGRNQQTLAAAMSKTEEFTIGQKKKHWNALSTSGRETKGPIIEETRTNETF